MIVPRHSYEVVCDRHNDGKVTPVARRERPAIGMISESAAFKVPVHHCGLLKADTILRDFAVPKPSVSPFRPIRERVKN
jgi:hypothetical protein